MTNKSKATAATATAVKADATPAKAAAVKAAATPATLYPTDVPFPSLVINVPNKAATLPARPGSARAKRWAVLLKMDGQTIGDYYKALRALGNPCSANNPRLAATKGLIKLVAPTATTTPTA